MNTLKIESPIGTLTALFTDDALRAVAFPVGCGCAGERAIDLVGAEPTNADPHDLRERFVAYFAGETDAFTDLALDAGGTPFQESVWEFMRAIPFGEVRTYGSIADELGKPSASRAVGAASGANPIPIITPCHRVVGASGSLTGFGGGLETKRRLLEHEGAMEVAGGNGRLF